MKPNYSKLALMTPYQIHCYFKRHYCDLNTQTLRTLQRYLELEFIGSQKLFIQYRYAKLLAIEELLIDRWYSEQYCISDDLPF